MNNIIEDEWVFKNKDDTDIVESRAKFKYRPLQLHKGFNDLVEEFHNESGHPFTHETLMVLKQVYDLRKTKNLFRIGFQVNKGLDSMWRITHALSILYEIEWLKDKDSQTVLTKKAHDLYKSATVSTNPLKWRNPNILKDWGSLNKDTFTHTQEYGDLIVIRGKQGSGKSTYGANLSKSISKNKKSIYLDMDLFTYDVLGQHVSSSVEIHCKYIRSVAGKEAYYGYVNYYLSLGYAVVVSNIYKTKSSLASSIRSAENTGSTFSLINVATPHSESDTALRLLNSHGVKDRTYKKYRLTKAHKKKWEDFDNFSHDFRPKT